MEPAEIAPDQAKITRPFIGQSRMPTSTSSGYGA